MSNRCAYQRVEIGTDGEPVFDADGQPIPAGSPPEIIELPIGAWGRTIVNPRRTSIVLETEKGRRWVFPQLERGEWSLPFDCLPDDLETFRTLDSAVGGNRDPFLFTFDVEASPIEWVFVRKDQDFDEGEEQPVSVNGVQRRVRYVLNLSEEPTGAEVTT